MYESVLDAKNAMTNSGVYEWFIDFNEDEMNEVYEYMWRYHMSPEEMADHYSLKD